MGDYRKIHQNLVSLESPTHLPKCKPTYIGGILIILRIECAHRSAATLARMTRRSQPDEMGGGGIHQP